MRPIPFFGNHDNRSCVQCCYRMMLSYFYPQKNWSQSDMDEFCGASPGKYTWMFKPLTGMINLGLNLVVYSNLNTQEFLASPVEYMIQKYGSEGAKVNIENTDMDKVLAQAKDYVESPEYHRIKRYSHSYTINMVKQLLDDGYLLLTWVNSRALNNLSGYSGHYILMHDHEPGVLIAHDPGGNCADGTPENQYPNRTIPQDDFMRSCLSGRGSDTGNLIAVRKL